MYSYKGWMDVNKKLTENEKFQSQSEDFSLEHEQVIVKNFINVQLV